MSTDKTTKLTSTRSEENANLLLQVGWTLLLIADRREGAYKWLVYQFGWQREGEPHFFAPTLMFINLHMAGKPKLEGPTQ